MRARKHASDADGEHGRGGDSFIDEIFMEHVLGASYYILGAGDAAGNQADKGPAFLEVPCW